LLLAITIIAIENVNSSGVVDIATIDVKTKIDDEGLHRGLWSERKG
jgi:hypothetical protein